MKDQMYRFITLLISENACKLQAKYTYLKERGYKEGIGCVVPYGVCRIPQLVGHFNNIGIEALADDIEN